MKTVKPIMLIICALTFAKAHAQKVFSVDRQYQADMKVFMVDHEYQADLIAIKPIRLFHQEKDIFSSNHCLAPLLLIPTGERMSPGPSFLYRFRISVRKR